MKRTYFLFFLLILLAICAGSAPCQVTQALVDTKRYLPGVNNFTQEKGWEITNRQYNMATRSIESQSIAGYRFLVDLDTAPRTALSIKAVVTLIRKGEVADPKTGGKISRARYAFLKAYAESQQGFLVPAREGPYGDESFTAAKDEGKFQIFIRRGDFIIDIAGSDHLPTYRTKAALEETCREMADFIDSRVFGARIGTVRAMQAFSNPAVPLVAGKKLIVYIPVETDKNAPFPAGNILNLSVGKRGFNRESYQIPLGAKAPVEFDPIADTSDGAVWKNETAEPVPIDDIHRAVFRLTHEPDYELRMYRFMLDPKDPAFFGNYSFRVSMADPGTGSKLREKVINPPTRPSKTLKILVTPLPVGYWAKAEQWRISDWGWLSGMKDRGWQNRSFTAFYASLPPELQSVFIGSSRNRDYLRKHLPLSTGRRRYLANIKEAGYLLKGILPVAEENFNLFIYEEFPQDLVMEPFPEDPARMLKDLEKWHSKHPDFHRVVGIIPGTTPKESGLDFYTDENTGPALWLNKKAALVSVDATPEEFAREVLYTFGAVNEWAPPEAFGANDRSILNRPSGVAGGLPIVDGFWPQKKQFMGTPLRAVNSIMGKIPPAWLPGEIYHEMEKRFSSP